MSDNMSTAIVTVLLAIIGVATLAVILSPKANTVNVIKAGAGGFSTDLGTALSPITGGGSSFLPTSSNN